jgi:hypothetical protein
MSDIAWVVVLIGAVVLMPVIGDSAILIIPLIAAWLLWIWRHG